MINGQPTTQQAIEVSSKIGMQIPFAFSTEVEQWSRCPGDVMRELVPRIMNTGPGFLLALLKSRTIEPIEIVQTKARLLKMNPSDELANAESRFYSGGFLAENGRYNGWYMTNDPRKYVEAMAAMDIIYRSNMTARSGAHYPSWDIPCETNIRSPERLVGPISYPNVSGHIQATAAMKKSGIQNYLRRRLIKMATLTEVLDYVVFAGCSAIKNGLHPRSAIYPAFAGGEDKGKTITIRLPDKYEWTNGRTVYLMLQVSPNDHESIGWDLVRLMAAEEEEKWQGAIVPAFAQ